MKRIIILGSTGSIGIQALDIIRLYPDKFKVTGLAVGSNTELLSRQIEEFKPQFVSVANGNYSNYTTTVLRNAVEVIRNAEADIILLAMVGISGLPAAYEAVGKGVRVALANKETLVAAGRIIIDRARQYNSEIIPVDSEHSAIWQCLMGNRKEDLNRIILTASGGAFRDVSKGDLINVKAVDALKHPVWNMGNKVTIDSATLMNKGLEVVEAKYLFDVKADQIDVIIHPESIIHSMVEYKDYGIISQMSNPDMRLPIQIAFTYPMRLPSEIKQLDLAAMKSLNFREPDLDRFPCLKIAYECLRYGGNATAVMNSANELAVQLYMRDEIRFYDIPALINHALDKYSKVNADTIEEIIGIDKDVKEYILTLTNK